VRCGKRSRTRPEDDADHRRRGVVLLIRCDGRARTGCRTGVETRISSSSHRRIRLFGPIRNGQLRLIPRQKIPAGCRGPQYRTTCRPPSSADANGSCSATFSLDRRGIGTTSFARLFSAISRSTLSSARRRSSPTSDCSRLLWRLTPTKESVQAVLAVLRSTNASLYWSDTTSAPAAVHRHYTRASTRGWFERNSSDRNDHQSTSRRSGCRTS